MAIIGDVSFCDDIRHEVTGKAILVGVYGAGMTIHAHYPVSIPRLCLACRLYIPASEFPEKAEVSIYYPNSVKEPDVITTAPLPARLTEEQIAASPRADEQYEVRYLVGFQFVLENIQVESDGFIRVRAKCDEQIIRMGDLRVVVKPPETIAPASLKS